MNIRCTEGDASLDHRWKRYTDRSGPIKVRDHFSDRRSDRVRGGGLWSTYPVTFRSEGARIEVNKCTFDSTAAYIDAEAQSRTVR
ncbi:hypothetical protein GCM10011410_10340 [Hoyosella rhizosphaerae]|uniref:Uncharacterized protein n=1 Tax=Hoyosella rhizosphaerae TaxID=1755582 RepID=A0A916U573_9ACTN|nr:hypothetical protein GCM10011410_10340 [Hoyosella rhizosphaerae]